jgi:hypothetical protein
MSGPINAIPTHRAATEIENYVTLETIVYLTFSFDF